MNKWYQSRFLWGGLIILVGVIFFLKYLGLFDLADLFWSLTFGVGGIIFLAVFIYDRTNWWAIIPGIFLLSIATVIALDYFVPDVSDSIGGSIVTGGIGLGFLGVYFVDRRNWWTIIPAGVMLTIAVAILLDPYVSETVFVGIFFLGVGLTFAVLALIPAPQGKMNWAWIPAGIIAVIGAIFQAISGQVLQIILALGLIAVGMFVIYRAIRSG